MNDQAEFARIVEPFRKKLEFSGSDITWWPLGKERHIVVDPKRNFGQPSAARSGVPTGVLRPSASKLTDLWKQSAIGSRSPKSKCAMRWSMRVAA